MNPLASHWLRLTFWLLVAAPAVALSVMLSTHASYTMALILTLYMWAIVCVILALIAFGNVLLRMLSRGMRALRR